MKVAVVGSGVSGLAATWLLNESGHEVYVYEADARPGGHANTVKYKLPGVEPVDVDTGFIVFNPSTYPNFLRFLGLHPSIEILPTEMTFSVSRDGGAFEWAGNNLFTIFCQPTRLLDPAMWRLVYDVLRFNACARRLLLDNAAKMRDSSIGEYLDQHGYSDSFRDNYLIPMTAAIWSTPPDKCAMDFPAHTLIQFMHNHHLLQVTGKPSWLTLKGGSRTYVNAILTELPKRQVHLSTPIESLTSESISGGSRHRVHLKISNGSTDTFDHVVLACHSDTAMSILQAGDGLTDEEQRVLGGFKWNRNEAVLHSDIELMPRRRLAWSCWNYLTSSAYDAQGNHKPNNDQVALTYWMNDLQHLSEKQHGPVLVTLNPPKDPAPEKTVGRYQYDHPVLDAQAIRSQQELHLIQNKRGVTFAGAWTKYGFHEDGFTSGLRAVADHLGVKPPFDIQDADMRPSRALVAYVFDILEWTGVRAILGFLFSFWLGVCRFYLSFFLDLSHIEVHKHRSSSRKLD